MQFKVAFEEMKKGHKVALPEWEGYWLWDADKKTIIIHTKEGEVLDFRSTPDFEFTLSFTFRDDWRFFDKPHAVETEERDPYWWEEVDFVPESHPVLRRGDSGEDVEALQTGLRNAGYNIKVDGDFGPATERVVRAFQKANGLVVDGIAGEKTYSKLKGVEFPGLLSQSHMEWAANELKVPVAAIMAVSEVESRGLGFFQSGRPAVLFERHWMRRRMVHYGLNPTPHIQRTPNLVNTATGGYQGGEREHDRIEAAMAIHETSALESASWGAYQIMGFHWEDLGYDSVQHFVECMRKNEGEHLKAFVRFIQNDSVLLQSLRKLDWTTFARRYNGPNFSKNQYDVRMSNAFRVHSASLVNAA